MASKQFRYCTDSECEYPDERTRDGSYVSGRFVCDGCIERNADIDRDNRYARSELIDACQRY